MAGSTLVLPSAERRTYSPWRETWRRYRRHKLAVVSVVLLLVLVAAVVLGPFLWRVGINEIDFNARTLDQLLTAVRHYAAQLGLAFQIIDDVLDVEGDAATLGKSAGKDAAGGKPSYPAIFGIERSRALAAECVASQLEGEPLPLEATLVDAIDPGRFAVKRARRGTL